MPIPYGAALTKRAKDEGLHLVRLEINGRFAKADSAERVMVASKEQAEKAWKLFTELAARRHGVSDEAQRRREMIDFVTLLDAVYEIQGNSDPGDSPDTLGERMARIREIADRVMDQSGYQPE